MVKSMFGKDANEAERERQIRELNKRLRERAVEVGGEAKPPEKKPE